MSKNSNKSGEGSTAIVKADAAPSLMVRASAFFFLYAITNLN